MLKENLLKFIFNSSFAYIGFSRISGKSSFKRIDLAADVRKGYGFSRGIKSLHIIPSKYMNALLNSRQVMVLLNIKSETTLIKYEREGLVKVARRFGNQKRYSALHISKLTGN